MKVGFVGTGWFGNEHAKIARKLGLEVSACFNVNSAKAETFAKTFGCRKFENPLEMISRKYIDILFIAIPPFAHDGSVEKAAVFAGIPFLCEKPIGLNLELCRDISDKIHGCGLVTSGGYMLRHGDSVAKVKNVLCRNMISIARTCRMGGFVPVHWWRKMSGSGGMMVEMATHQVDFMIYLLGDISSVSAVTSSGINSMRFENCDVYDSMAAQVVFRSRAIGSIAISNVLNNKDQPVPKCNSLEICGQDFFLTYNMDSDKISYKEGNSEWVTIPVESNDMKLELEHRNFINAVKEENPALVLGTYADALKTLEVTLAMNESTAKGGVPVKIGL
ncbi:MAG: Gfo/Idh/MocA family oxidoreductase [Victivallales bacterium]